MNKEMVIKEKQYTRIDKKEKRVFNIKSDIGLQHYVRLF